jgi:tripeptidyl-peptidase-1
MDGTRASCPIFASTISLLNDRLIAAGRPVLGFLNPFLYSGIGRAAFNDITTGASFSLNDAVPLPIIPGLHRK